MSDAAIGAGFAFDPAELESAEGDGILCFEEADDHLVRFINDCVRSSDCHLLAVRVSPEPLDREMSWKLLRAGAADVVVATSAEQAMRTIAARVERWSRVERLLASRRADEPPIGGSQAWRRLIRQVVEVAHFTKAPILLCGESGTGKELVADVIHRMDRDASGGDLVIVDCTTVMPELSGSEFFGHERGAFTGAASVRDGAFAGADGGTLFLDEIGELPLPLQAQLLRVIQEGCYKRVGSDVWRRSSFRLVSATHRDLPALVGAGRFRQDLYYRMAGWVFRVPPLRERREDIVLLAEHFLSRLRTDLPGLRLDPGLAHHLVSRDYPGNVRELRQLMSRIASRHVGPGPVTLGALPIEDWPAPDVSDDVLAGTAFEALIHDAVCQGVGLREIREAAAEVATRVALRHQNGNLHAAARALRVTDRALQMRRAARRQLVKPSGQEAAE